MTSKLVAKLALADLVEGVAKRIPLPPYDVAVVRQGGQVFAIEDACNHSGASLSKGRVCGEEISCPLHGYVFSVRSGALLRPRGLCGPQRTFRTELDGDDVLIWEDVAVALV